MTKFETHLMFVLLWVLMADHAGEGWMTAACLGMAAVRAVAALGVIVSEAAHKD